MSSADENILQEMLDRVLNPAKNATDEMAADIFCKLIKNNAALIGVAHDMLIRKIYSKRQDEAFRAIGLLEECMSNCGVEFQKKTAKFLFLNKLIQLVMDRHDASPASIEVKKRIMDCLLLWTVEYSDKTKIREAYENLKKQVKFEHSSISPGPVVFGEKPRSILGKDEDLISQLLNAGGTENYKKANLLIQHRYSQETKRAERMSQHKAKVKETQNTINLLNDMLDIYFNQPMSNDDKETLRVLYDNCVAAQIRFTVIQENKFDLDEELLQDTEAVHNMLLQCIERYKQLENGISNSSVSKPSNQKTNTESTTNNVEILTELIGDELIIAPKSAAQKTNTSMAIKEELNDIFGNISTNPINESNEVAKDSSITDLLVQIDPLEGTITKNNSMTAHSNEEVKKEPRRFFKELAEIDKLSEELLLKNLKHGRRSKSFKKEPEKLALNDMVNDKINTINTQVKIGEQVTQQNYSKEALVKTTNCDNEEVPMALGGIGGEESNKSTAVVMKNTTEKVMQNLSSIQIDLDEVTPLVGEERILLNDEHLQVILNMATNRPQCHVFVMVVTISNKSTETVIKDVSFHAGVKKVKKTIKEMPWFNGNPCKVRLLPPNDTTLMAVKSFRPSVPINQIILLWNPTECPIDITGIINYKLGDSSEPFSEPLVAKKIPYLR